jgi:hypothetical protein
MFGDGLQLGDVVLNGFRVVQKSTIIGILASGIAEHSRISNPISYLKSSSISEKVVPI